MPSTPSYMATEIHITFAICSEERDDIRAMAIVKTSMVKNSLAIDPSKEVAVRVQLLDIPLARLIVFFTQRGVHKGEDFTHESQRFELFAHRGK